ncbi:TetR family transcriptional regulator [Streptococcus sp. zg-86]|uniref:TetR family transcriptional regulator n=1 Tax=Streptococcus zhangguiae TaxID=2664091 RepID=A0A6I4RBS2_9STRE|nr:MULTISPECIES: TetR/AcrR family transcriptional regulator [Streptococcus]MTB64976.1 TetR family transcriptional regulator [Streptococcus sp. zg-86]MTB91190.1 TetR family transcriptional regulator [Streptococcus sp. zg-36]MWV56939.1 TetR family transcriptional regulator [Streptococcus sp. zg-70]QTH47177.1 TetR/AcrR family transcriptional regulator [Streptococcus sp. zg-86]
MKKRMISPKSLKNLSQSNTEINQLTRESIETALLFLLEKKELKHISISELVKKAGVSRNAFYRNYKSKEEILELAYAKTSQNLMDKWQQLQKKVQEEGIQQSFTDFLQQQKGKVEDTKTFSNISQWIKDKTNQLNNR